MIEFHKISFSVMKTTINDSLGNVYKIQDSFKLNLISEVISSKKSKCDGQK